MNERGIGLIELMIGLVLTVLVVGLCQAGFKLYLKADKRTANFADLDQDLLGATQHIRRIGRVARSCVKSGSELDCKVDFTFPVTNVETSVRFLHVPDKRELLFQKEDPAGIWVTQIRYTNVKEFILCDDADMAAGTCPITPVKVSAVNTAVPPRILPEPPRANRFYRYQLKGEKAEASENYQSAFYVRNPTSFGPNLFYQYGG